MSCRSQRLRLPSSVRVATAILMAALLAACSSSPGAPLIGKASAPVPRVTTGNAVEPDGFPNPLVDPVKIEGTPLTAAEQAQLEADLAERRDATRAQANF